MSRLARTGHNLMPPNEIGSRDGLWPSIFVVVGTRRAASVPILIWWRLERKSWAGKGLSRRGLKERAPGGSAHSRSPKDILP
jgi:hypothetical protein